MSIEENKAIVRRIFEDGLNTGNEQALLGELVDENFVYHAADGRTMGLEELVDVANTRNAFPDVHFEIHNLVAEGDMVAAHYTISGTNQGAFFGIPPSGKHLSFWTMSISRIAGGKMVEFWELHDFLTALKQSGAYPTDE